MCDGKKASSPSLKLRKKTFDFQHQTDHSSTGEQNARQTKKFDTTDEIHERRKKLLRHPNKRRHTRKFFVQRFVPFRISFPTRHTKHTQSMSVHWLCDTCISPTSRSLTHSYTLFLLFLHSSFPSIARPACVNLHYHLSDI